MVCLLFGRSCNGAPVPRHWWAQLAGSDGGWSACVLQSCFAIEGKSYALLLLLVALAWWWRRSEGPLLYALASALAGITHFYGLFLVLAAAVWDGLKGRTRFAVAALMAALPGLARPGLDCLCL